MQTWLVRIELDTGFAYNCLWNGTSRPEPEDAQSVVGLLVAKFPGFDPQRVDNIAIEDVHTVTRA